MTRGSARFSPKSIPFRWNERGIDPYYPGEADARPDFILA